jgi:hypothetical protein
MSKGRGQKEGGPTNYKILHIFFYKIFTVRAGNMEQFNEKN